MSSFDPYQQVSSFTIYLLVRLFLFDSIEINIYQYLGLSPLFLNDTYNVESGALYWVLDLDAHNTHEHFLHCIYPSWKIFKKILNHRFQITTKYIIFFLILRHSKPKKNTRINRLAAIKTVFEKKMRYSKSSTDSYVSLLIHFFGEILHFALDTSYYCRQ